MQDSLEDYLKFTKNDKPDEQLKISKEVVVTAQRKKECDARAMKIVEFSIDGKLRAEVFTKCLPFINQSHYQDIVEERALTKLCGYSICGKRIPDMPKKQYFISTKSNKIYDITERKNFCSNFCYKASLHIKKQIDNSPLWLRKLEEIPEYKLLNSSEGGLPGEYIDQGIVKPVYDPKFTSVASFTQASLGDLVTKDINPGKSKKDKAKSYKKPSRLKSTMQTIKENEVEEEMQVSAGEMQKKTNKNQEKKCSNVIKKESHHKKSCVCVLSLPSIEENEERLLQIKETEEQKIKMEAIENSQENLQDIKEDKREQIKLEMKENIPHETTQFNESIEINTEHNTIKEDPTEKKKGNIEKSNQTMKKSLKKKTSSKPKSVDIESVIKKALDDWLTLETCIFIHGEEKVKMILNEKKLSDYFECLKIPELQIEQQKKYMEVCRRLQLQELADDKFDNAAVGNQKLKPLPDFKKLKEDTKDMNLKVKSFYVGGMYEKDDTNFPTQINKKDQDTDLEEGPPAVLPPVDVNSQNLMRRKIFLNSLNRAIHQLLQTLEFSQFSSILSDIQALVRTFSLKADNITFKPIIWNYVALVLLDL